MLTCTGLRLDLLKFSDNTDRRSRPSSEGELWLDGRGRLEVYIVLSLTELDK